MTIVLTLMALALMAHLADTMGAVVALYFGIPLAIVFFC